MKLLTIKGFLGTNTPLPMYSSFKKIHILDAIWAGTHVEPRILEVLPAALLRFPQYFSTLDKKKHPDLYELLQEIKNKKKEGKKLWGIDYKYFLPWTEIQLKDKRTKFLQDKKVTKTFRIKPSVLSKLKILSQKQKCTETEIIEKAISLLPD